MTGRKDVKITSPIVERRKKSMEPYGYLLPGGYYGRLKDGNYRLFPTEQEYLEFFREDL